MTGIKSSWIVIGLMLVSSPVLLPTPAQAQAPRTWVSGVGDDANPCSRTSPCRTFVGAMSKTVAGGEISVLEPGGFGAVTITKAISITNDGPGEAGIQVSAANAITVNAGAQDVVRLYGLIIDGGAQLNSPAGIRFLAGGELHVEKCVIKNFQLAGAGFGIHFTPASPANLYVSDTVIVHNVNGTDGAGIHINPTGNGGVKAVLNRVQTYTNGVGLKVDGSASTNPIRLVMNDSVMALNAMHGVWVTSASAQSAVYSIRNQLVQNQINGVLADGGMGAVVLSDSTITTNGTGVAATNGGGLFSYKNNNINGNLKDDGTIPSGNIMTQN